MAPIPSSDTLGYVRVSTEQQATEQKTSLADQRRLITERAMQMGRVLKADAIFEDAGVSGATADGRPAFMAMRRFCETNQRTQTSRGLIVVLNDSRFGRFDDPEDALYYRVAFKKLGWDIRFCESDEVEDPLGRSVIRLVGSAQASEYRVNLRRTAKRAARATAAKGRWQQEAPLGYRRLGIRGDGAQRVLEIGQRKAADEYVVLTLGPQGEQDAIRWMFDRYGAGGLSLGALTREMIDCFPLRKWSTSTIGATLRNPAYVGDVVWCRRVTDKTERLTRRVRDKSDWVVTANAHPALVTRDLFERVKERMALNKRQTTATAGGYPLAGLIRCAQCGMHFAGGGGRKGPPEDIDRYRFYRDTGGTTRVPVCCPPITTLRKRWLEEKVYGAITRLVMDSTTQKTIRAEVEKVMRSPKEVGKEQRVTIERERQRVLTQRKRLVESIANGTLTEGEAASTMAELRARLSAADSEFERLRFAERAMVSHDDAIERMIRVAQDFPSQLKRLEGSALRELVRPWIADAVVDKKKRLLTLTLWRIPIAAGVFRLHNQPEPGSP